MPKNEIQDLWLHKEHRLEQEISQDIPFLAKRGKENFFTINEWDFWLAPSNSQLDSHFVGIDVFFRWSIDRVTLVGEVCEIIEKDGQKSSIASVLDYLADDELSVIKLDNNAWKLVDVYGENVAHFSFPKFQKGKGRLDFNPNKLGQHGKWELKSFVKTIFKEAHFSRADVACDFLNMPDDKIREYDLHKSVGRRIWFDKVGLMETTYWGSSASREQVRLYNKRVEQTQKGYSMPEHVSTWWRLEFQLRSDKISEWYDELSETLKIFYALNPKSDNLSVQDEIYLTALKSNPDLWNKISKNSKTKFRKLTREIALTEDFLTVNLLKSYEISKDCLREELEFWLMSLNVVSEEIK